MSAHSGSLKDNRAAIRLPLYRTRWMVWLLLIAGWLGGATAIVSRGGAVEWFMTAVITIIALISGLAPYMATKGIEAVRIVSRTQVESGGEAEVSLVVKRAYTVPFVWLAVQDLAVNQTSMADRHVRFRVVQLAPWLQESNVTYTLKELERGKHQFAEVTITAGDWLGLTAVHRRLKVESELIVLPSAPVRGGISLEDGGADLHMEEPPLSADDRNELVAAELKTSMGREGIGPESRPFREGDSLRHVDWRSAARGSDWMTKLHSHERPIQKLIVLDTAADSYERKDRLFDAAASWVSLALEEAVLAGNEAVLLTGQQHKAPFASASGQTSGHAGGASVSGQTSGHAGGAGVSGQTSGHAGGAGVSGQTSGHAGGAGASGQTSGHAGGAGASGQTSGHAGGAGVSGQTSGHAGRAGVSGQTSGHAGGAGVSGQDRVDMLYGSGERSSYYAAIEGARTRLYELQLHLAQLRASDDCRLRDEVKELLKSGIRESTLYVFTGDWRSGAVWCELAALAAEHSCRLQLFIVTGSSVPSFAMRETQKWLESCGMKLSWLHEPERASRQPFAEEGGAFYAYAKN